MINVIKYKWLVLLFVVFTFIVIRPIYYQVYMHNVKKEIMRGNADFAKKYHDTSICRVGKTITEMELNASIAEATNEYSTPNKLFKCYGKPDTIVKENIMKPCSSYIYLCKSRYIAYHYGEDNKYFGCTAGKLINGKFVPKTSGLMVK